MRFLPLPHIEPVFVDDGARRLYGMIYAKQRHAGTPIPTNDIWIAAHAFESGGELITFDQHFEVVPGLALVRPS